LIKEHEVVILEALRDAATAYYTMEWEEYFIKRNILILNMKRYKKFYIQM
jgi:hypothetical protein